MIGHRRCDCHVHTARPRSGPVVGDCYPEPDAIVAALGTVATAALVCWGLIRLAGNRLSADPSAMQARLLGT